MEPIAQTAMRLSTVVRHIGEKIMRTGCEPMIAGLTSDGDIMTTADKVAADAARENLKNSGIHCSLLLEETGGIEKIHKNPNWLVILDELDGSRPARLGFDAAGICSVTAALIPINEEPILANVVAAASYSLSDHTFVAVKGQGIKKNGKQINRLEPTRETEIENAIIFNEHMGECGILEGFYKHIFNKANSGGHFYIASSSAAARMIIQGKADAHIHLGKRMRDRFPEWQSRLLGPNKPPGMMPWDLASYYLLCKEAKAIVTDGFGKPLDQINLITDAPKTQASVITTGSRYLHQLILARLEKVDQYLEDNSKLITKIINQASVF